MTDIIKTEYMDKPTIGYSEYLFLDMTALNAQSPKPGDRAVVLTEGTIYFCINQGEWLLFGGSSPSPTYKDWNSLKQLTWSKVSTYRWNQIG